HVRSIGTPHMKSMEVLPEPVTQKLETPVIYFYGHEGEVSVEVDFPSGIISEWYPGSTDYGPDLGSMERVAEGRMRWDLELRAPAASTVGMPPVDADSVW